MIINKDIEDYIKKYSSQEDKLLAELNRETHLKAINPRMLSGHPQGKFLEIISKIINPTNILEIGTFTGYSAICLARGLQNNGILHTIEKNDEIIDFAKKYFEREGISKNISIHIGYALEIIPTLNIKFDLIFIDADKQQYTEYFNKCINKINKGGIILTDNVLWDGKVLDSKTNSDADTKAIINFNNTVLNDKRVEVVILPIRDGISVIRKL